MVGLSVVTLVDSSEHLQQACQSLLRQSHEEWEWLLVPVGDRGVPTPAADDDPRVRVVTPPRYVSAQGVQACRQHAFESARFDYVVEFDQHDFLSEGALTSIAGALEATGADVVYPDFALVPVDNPVAGYAPEYGWETYTAVDGKLSYRAVRAFEPEPSALHQPDYAPSRALTWRREVFFAVGGPVATLQTADTFDLLCRSYLAGATFHHIPECLVFSRMDHYRRRYPAIEAELSARYAHQIVNEWSRRQGLAKLDLGAARNPAPGFTSVDLQDAEIMCDIRRGLPVDDNSVGCVRAFDFLEHMSHCPDSACAHGADGGPLCAVGVMNELWRVLAPGGWLVSRTPSTDGRGAFQDPTHTSYWNQNSFFYYTRAEQARFLSGVKCRFQAARLTQLFPTDWHVENNVPYVDADLVALKGQRQPGICWI